MTRDEVIRLAEAAGWDMHDGPDGFTDRLERFAALVSAAEREACARVCEAQRDARIETRPARVEFSDNAMSLRCAAAIHARGEK